VRIISGCVLRSYIKVFKKRKNKNFKGFFFTEQNRYAAHPLGFVTNKNSRLIAFLRFSPSHGGNFKNAIGRLFFVFFYVFFNKNRYRSA
jgi:hypothetical protein